MSVQAPAEEQVAIREACGIVDRSERGKLALSGPGAADFLNGQVTNDVAALAPGEGCYAAFLTHKGKMLGDLRVLSPRAPATELVQSTAPELWLDTERGALQALFDMIRRFAIGYDLELHKRTLERGLISLLGPEARTLSGATEAGLPDQEHANAPGRLGGVAVQLVATVDGVDVLCLSEDAAGVRADLEQRGARAVSEGAAEVLRIERGRPRYGVDMDASTMPEEAGIEGRAVSFTKGCYVGQETVARLHWRGRPNRRLRGLALDGPAAAGDEVRLDGRGVGTVTSAAESPVLGPIALALLRREAEPGERVAVGTGNGGRVVELPFPR